MEGDPLRAIEKLRKLAGDLAEEIGDNANITFDLGSLYFSLDEMRLAHISTLAPDRAVKAPWSQMEIKRLNEYQRCGMFHPYTCNCGRRYKVTPDGFKCDCGGHQGWAYALSFCLID